jgi:Uma2 family endonuclease
VEVVSPSNAESELRAKTTQYLNSGAVEVWLGDDDGTVEIYTKHGPREDSSFGFDPAALLLN